MATKLTAFKPMQKELKELRYQNTKLKSQVNQAKIIFAAQVIQCLDHYWGPLMDQAIKKFLKDSK